MKLNFRIIHSEIEKKLNHFMKKNTLIICLLLSANCFSQLNIVPMPAEVKMGKGYISLTNKFVIIPKIANGEELEICKYLQKELNDLFSLYLKIDTFFPYTKISENCIFIATTSHVDDRKADYSLSIAKNTIFIGGVRDYQNLFYGVQTFLQLIKNEKNKVIVPRLTINDYPRFAYRGMHLDVCRHFFPIPFIKKYIDYLATYKFNTFHWHLTDDQGWRIDIKKYPELTTVGASRNGTTTQ